MVEDWSVEKVSASTAIERGSVGFESTDKVQRVTKAASKAKKAKSKTSRPTWSGKRKKVRAGLTNKQTAPKFCAHGVLLGLRPLLLGRKAKVSKSKRGLGNAGSRNKTKRVARVCAWQPPHN